MNSRDLVAIDPRARAAWPWLPDQAPLQSIWQAPGGDTVRVLAGGSIEAIGGFMPRRSIAADPCALER